MCVRIGFMILAAIGASAIESIGCVCAGPGVGRCGLPDAPVSFAGMVISKQVIDLHPPIQSTTPETGRRSATDPQLTRDNSYTAVTFQVTEPFRGDSGNTVIIRDEPVCSNGFEVGHEYLVFAYPQDGNLRTGPCAGTRRLTFETALIHQLRSARAGKGMADIFGLIYPQWADPSFAGPQKSDTVGGVRVTAKSDREEYQTVTSADGSYEFRGLPPETYIITAQAPARRVISRVYASEVGRGDACRADFELSYQGRISGMVVDSSGQPVSGGVSAYAAASDRKSGVVQTTGVEAGRFEFNTIAPGHYRLRFFISVNGRAQAEFIYYPGTRIEADAAEITIGDGTQIEGLQFTLP